MPFMWKKKKNGRLMTTDTDDTRSAYLFSRQRVERGKPPSNQRRGMGREQRRGDQWLALSTQVYQATDDGDTQLTPISSSTFVL